jgi:hypothetical protein
MKPKLILIGIFVCLLTYPVRGQDEKRKFFFVDSGVDFFSSLESNKDYIRGDINPYSYGNVTDQLTNLLYYKYFGVKFEYRVLHNKIGISSGLRYTRMNGSIGKTSYWSSTTDFYYVQFDNNGTTTEYAKVKEINQKSNFIGVPLELRVYPFDDHPVNFFGEIGASFNLSLGSKTDIVFFDNSMNTYRNQVEKVIEAPWLYYATYNIGAGFKIGRLTKPGVDIGANIVGMLVPDKSSLIKPDVGGGIQLMIRVPF